MAETPYVETEVLLARLSGERDRVRQLMADMSTRELEQFTEQLTTLLIIDVMPALRERRSR